MKSLAEHDGLLYSAKMDSGGKYVPLDLESIPVTANDREYHWLQMCATHLDTRRYLEENTHLDSLVIDALLAEDTRPRVLQRDDGTMLILRAMNFTPGGKPEDMISLRMWITQGCILSFRLRDALAIDDLKAMIASNRAPDRIGNFVTAITDRVYSRMEPVIDQLVDDTAILEELVARKEANEAFDDAAPLRIKTAILRRHIVPQRAALDKLIKSPPKWLQKEDIEQLTESEDQITRYIESLNDIRDRHVIMNDEISRQIDQRMASTNYLFALAATIFLPLSFLTGLLGVNMGGMPGVQSEAAFPILVGFCVVAAAIQIIIFRRKGWL